MSRHAICITVLVAAAGLCFVGSHAMAQTQSAPAQSDVGLGVKGIGARLGYVDPEDASGTAAFGVHVDAGTIVRNVHVTPYFEYWSAGASVGTSSVDFSDLTIATDVNLDFPMHGSRMTPYLGGGLGLHFLSFDSTPGPSPGNETKFGFNIQGGVRNQVMPNISIFGEARYAFVTDANQLKLMGGFTYLFMY